MTVMDFLYTQVVPVVLILIMAGLGLTLTPADFARVMRQPKAAAVGLAAQMLLLPLLAFALAWLFAPAAAIAVGLVILAACPSGITANAYTFAARADVALCVTLAAVTSLLIVFTLPLLTWLGMIAFFEQGQVPDLPTGALILRLINFTVVPIAAGMTVRALWPAFTQRLVEPLRKVTLAVLIFVLVAAAATSYEVVLENLAAAGALVVTMNVLSMAMGYALARAFRLSTRQSVTITFEVGVQNLALALLITLTIFQQPALAVTALIYAVVMPLTALAFVDIGRRLIARSEESATADASVHTPGGPSAKVGDQ